VQTSLLTSGLQVEMTQAVMAARAVHPPSPLPGLDLVPLDFDHLEAAHQLLWHEEGEKAPSLEEIDQFARLGLWWVLTQWEEVVGLVAHEDAPGGVYTVIQVMASHRAEAEVLWAIHAAGRVVEKAGCSPASVVDMRDQRSIDLFRRSDYFTAAAYLVFYDPPAGRPGVGLVGVQEVRAALQRGEPLRMVDVMGDEP